MKINSIELKNFGSYEGLNFFNTKIDDKNIILVGGKNGAGKTTLFTAVRLCLYGYRTYGLKGIQSEYKRDIAKLINRDAKLKLPVETYVQLDLSINNGQEYDQYVLTRSWFYDKKDLTEHFFVQKNGVNLSDEEIADFENFIIQIIPNYLFDLYFFDGEKIADYFLDEKGQERMKDAFLKLCGYDTFEIMRDNFKRLHTYQKGSSAVSDDYMKIKDELDQFELSVAEKKKELENCRTQIEDTILDKKNSEKAYTQSGGISQEVWDEKLAQIDKEEKFREEKNTWFKKVAETEVPFLILSDELKNLEQQILNEDLSAKKKAFCEILNETKTIDLFKNIIEKHTANQLNVEKLLQEVSHVFKSNNIDILSLSNDQKYNLSFVVKNLLALDKSKIIDEKKLVKKSLENSKRIREEIEKCNIDSIKEYIAQQNEFENKIFKLEAQQKSIELEFIEFENQRNELNSKFQKIKKLYEDEIKKDSIKDISLHAMDMMEELQKDLYTFQIRKVEDLFMKNIKKLIRKENFIDDIEIDNDFNIKIFRNKEYTLQEIYDIIKKLSPKEYAEVLGQRVLDQLIQEIPACKDLKRLAEIISRKPENWYTFQMEIDRTTLSKGEKQVFIMALYKSLMDLCQIEVPFVIDTPFARIDTEHRKNIAKNFFMQLKGQIFILSTNEEITNKHVGILKDKIGKTYMLENTDNKKTIIKEDEYFGE